MSIRKDIGIIFWLNQKKNEDFFVENIWIKLLLLNQILFVKSASAHRFNANGQKKDSVIDLLQFESNKVSFRTGAEWH